jgi:hypothetical protein
MVVINKLSKMKQKTCHLCPSTDADNIDENNECNNCKQLISSHPPTQDCDDAECWICAARDCPHREPMHYHHDGCPACIFADQEN